MTKDKKLSLSVAVIAIGGIVLVSIFSHWAVALGIFLMLWANNVEQDRRNERKFLPEDY